MTTLLLCLASVNLPLFIGHGEAQTAASATFQVNATVPPLRYIIVNIEGTILEITSNTSLNVTPIVCVNKISEQTIPLSVSVKLAYDLILARTNLKIGIIYQNHAQPAGTLENYVCPTFCDNNLNRVLKKTRNYPQSMDKSGFSPDKHFSLWSS